MSFLLLYLGEGRKFDDHALSCSLSTLDGAKSIRPDDDCLLSYEYQHGDDVTTIRCMKDLETIAIDGAGSASLCAALHIQVTYPEDIHLIDESYSFDVVLRGIDSVSELERQIREVGG
jgi:hypothetical protein